MASQPTLRTAAQWSVELVQCQVKPATAAKWSVVFENTIRVGTFSRGDEDIKYFLGQILVESARLEKLEENLDYSAERLIQVWPSRFPTLGDARFYAHSPEALANKVYGGRMGNVNPGDGWRYRGRSPICVTGLDAYRALGELCGQDFVSVPDLLVQPHFALEAAIHWWENRIPDSMLGDTVQITRRVNGGLIGLADRQHLTDAAGQALA
jgi:putative chitinase